jgi:hypothetical protein
MSAGPGSGIFDSCSGWLWFAQGGAKTGFFEPGCSGAKEWIKIGVCTSEYIVVFVQGILQIDLLSLQETSPHPIRILNINLIPFGSKPTTLGIIHPEDAVFVDASDAGIIDTISVSRKGAIPYDGPRCWKHGQGATTSFGSPGRNMDASRIVFAV